MRTVISLIFATIIIFGCTTTRVNTDPVTGASVTNSIVDPRFSEGINVARGINAATAPVSPWAGLIDYALVAALATASWIAKKKNDDRNKQATLLKTVVQAVEATNNADVKEAISNHAVNMGVQGELHSEVQKIVQE
jgi:hypothetical protein